MGTAEDGAIQATTGIEARRQRMNIPDLPSLDPKQVTVRHRPPLNAAIQPGKAEEDIHRPHHLVDDVSPVGNLDVTRKAEVARVVPRRTDAGVSPALETRVRRAEGHGDVAVGEAVEVCVGRGFDCCSAVSLARGDGSPVLGGAPAEVARGVDGPVAGFGYD